MRKLIRSWGGGCPLDKTKWVLLSTVMLVTACGGDVRAVYDRSLYHTNEFAANHYVDTVIAKSFQPEHISFTTTWAYPAEDVSNQVPTSQIDPFGDAFAQTYKLSKAMPAIQYGFESKLFDGILFCTDAQRLSKSRLQLLPSGFGYVFPNTLDQYSTLGLFMKAGADTNQGGQKIKDLEVSFSFYRPSILGWEQLTFQIEIQNLVSSNFPGYYQINLPPTVLKGAKGISLTYAIIDPVPSVSTANLTGLFVYEFLLPGSTWSR